MAATYYNSLLPSSLVSYHGLISKSDTLDVSYIRFSENSGKSWSEPLEYQTKFDRCGGTERRHLHGGVVIPGSGLYVNFSMHGIFPNDNPLEGMTHWKLSYSVSMDGGRTNIIEEQIIHEGMQYDEKHFMPGVTEGCNCVMIGDYGQRPLLRAGGLILMPVMTTPVGPDGRYFNPGGGYTWTDCMLLIGKIQPDHKIKWTCSERISLTPDKTTRGLIEPTIAELADGAILMVMRGSNDANPSLPGYKWYSLSKDGGYTWAMPEPWRYDTDESFFSPSSCSQLIPHSNGHLYWMGNITGENPKGNGPRYPLVLGEVDAQTGLLVKDSIAIVDDKQAGESPWLQLSSFYAREDFETNDILLHMTRSYANDYRKNGVVDFTADALLYRIKLKQS